MKYKIKFKDMTDKKMFVFTASQMNFDVDLKNGNYTCDAKSMLGTVSMPSNESIIADFITDNQEKVEKDFDYWIVSNRLD